MFKKPLLCLLSAGLVAQTVFPMNKASSFTMQDLLTPAVAAPLTIMAGYWVVTGMAFEESIRSYNRNDHNKHTAGCSERSTPWQTLAVFTGMLGMAALFASRDFARACIEQAHS